MGLLGQVLTGVVASRMGRGGLGGGGFGGGMGGPLGGVLGGAMMGGMGRGGRGSPIMKGLLLLLAANAARDYMGRSQTGGAQGQGQAGGGGLLGGIAGGGGLGALIEQFTRNGHGEAIKSWVAPGPNQPLPPQKLAEALGPETVQALEQETGLPREEVLQELSETLPEAVDQLTPEGAAPDPSLLAGDDENLDELTRPG